MWPYSVNVAVKFRHEEPELFQSGGVFLFFIEWYLNLISKLGDFELSDF